MVTTGAGARLGDFHYATDGRDILLNTPDGWEVDEPWRWWDGPADAEDGTGGPWGNPPPGARAAAPSLRGMTLPAVTRCTQLLTDNVASMPWKVYRGRERLQTPSWISDPQAQRLDGRRPTADVALARLSPVEFWAQAITSYLWWGEALIYTPRTLDADGQPTGPIVAPLYNLHPLHVELEDGVYRVRDDTEPGGYYAIDPRELIVVRHMVTPGFDRALGVIPAHAADLGLYAAVRSYADNMFQRGIPQGYLKSSKPDLDQAMADRLKRSWMRAHGGTRKGIAVLNATTTFEPLSLDPQTTQLLDLMRLSAWQVALMFGVPPSKLGIDMGESNTYSNLEAAGTAFVNDALVPIARKFESAFDSVLPVGQTLKIDFRQLMRGDTAARYDAYSTGLAAGFLTVDEVRDWEDLPPLPSRDDTPGAGVTSGDDTAPAEVTSGDDTPADDAPAALTSGDDTPAIAPAADAAA
jgi:HK97 family phage portal protein